MIVLNAVLALAGPLYLDAPVSGPPQLGHTHMIETPAMLGVAVQPGGHLFAGTFQDSSVRIYDAATLKKIHVFRGHPQPAYAVAWSNDGKYLATGDESARVFIWDIATGQRLMQFRAHSRGIGNLCFSKDGTLLLSTGKDYVLKVYNLKSKKVWRTIDPNGAGIYGGEFDPANGSIATATLLEGARMYSPVGTLTFTSNSHTEGAFDLDFNSTGTSFITAGKDGTVILWDAGSGKRIGTLKGHEDMALHVAFAPNGRVAASSSVDRTVRLWDTKHMTQLGVLEQQYDQGSPVKFTGDGKYLISTSINGYAEVTPVTPAQGAGPVKPVKAKAKRHRRRRTD